MKAATKPVAQVSGMTVVALNVVNAAVFSALSMDLVNIVTSIPTA
jgi:hypothetical protein